MWNTVTWAVLTAQFTNHRKEQDKSGRPNTPLTTLLASISRRILNPHSGPREEPHYFVRIMSEINFYSNFIFFSIIMFYKVQYIIILFLLLYTLLLIFLISKLLYILIIFNLIRIAFFI